MPRIIKLLARLIGILIALLVLFILYLTVNQYRPKDIQSIKIKNIQPKSTELPDTISVLTWNIGYAGLGKEMDFFYEGGKMVRPTNELHKKYMSGIIHALDSLKPYDFLFIQEVDEDSHRSYFTDEVKDITSNLSQYNFTYAINYKVAFVPAPLWSPMGRVKGGLMTLSKYNPDTSLRVAYPQIQSWPKSLAFLNRCFIENRYMLNNGKELVIFNTHNSFFNNDSTLRYEELNILKNKMLEEYKKGNYILAGGDWNQTPTGFEPEDYPDVKHYIYTAVNLYEGYFPKNWNVVYDATTPSARFNDMPYEKGKTEVSLIDFFVCSPNIEVIKVKTLDLGFTYSDHNPVKLEVRLKE